MTDGPFRNAELTSLWKQYGRDLVSDAASASERTDQACRSMLGDLNRSDIASLLKAIQEHAERPQMDLDATAPVKTLFEGAPNGQFQDSLQKHLLANLYNGMALANAHDLALQDTVTDLIGITKNRMEEHCMRARDCGDMKLEDYRKAVERNSGAFAGIDKSSLCEALSSGDKRAFKKAHQKKTGINEGPDE